MRYSFFQRDPFLRIKDEHTAEQVQGQGADTRQDLVERDHLAGVRRNTLDVLQGGFRDRHVRDISRCDPKLRDDELQLLSRAASTKHGLSADNLCHDTAHGPDVYSSAIVGEVAQQLGCTIPPRHYVLCHAEVRIEADPPC